MLPPLCFSGLLVTQFGGALSGTFACSKSMPAAACRLISPCLTIPSSGAIALMMPGGSCRVMLASVCSIVGSSFISNFAGRTASATVMNSSLSWCQQSDLLAPREATVHYRTLDVLGENNLHNSQQKK